jgi:hypothetical protein
MQTFIPGQLDTLLDEGGAAKLACMRQTAFIESADLVPLVFTACQCCYWWRTGKRGRW